MELVDAGAAEAVENWRSRSSSLASAEREP